MAMMRNIASERGGRSGVVGVGEIHRSSGALEGGLERVFFWGEL